jgi:hypothetical protein
MLGNPDPHGTVRLTRNKGKYMNRLSSIGAAFCAVISLLSSGALPGTLPFNETPQIASSEDTDVIVILRDQLPDTPGRHGEHNARASAVDTAQAPILSELQRAGARKIHAFHLINAVATTVTKAEAEQLAAHPLVQAVVPDGVIRAPKRQRTANGAATGAAYGHASSALQPANAGSTATGSTNALCNTLEPEALQLTNAAFTNAATPQAQEVLDGNGEPITGKGVKVAYIADGLDPNLPGFIRPDGSHVFIDYQDFSGDPAGTPTEGGEAFGDASSIAAQDGSDRKPLIFDISKFVSAAHPLPSPCNIRIRGMAPGASLVGLKALSVTSGFTLSSVVQAIEYAVVTDDVDVINESLGINAFPDNDTDPISLADNAAVRAGVTVVVSTGDAGTADTVAASATDSEVISVGATTQFRLYAQVHYGIIALTNGGYIDNNISAFSSSGFSQSGARTPSVVAPGDLGWALCSTNVTLFTDCDNSYAGPPAPIQVFGGTSESAPLTAGEAALVIQAYRSTHRGVDPTPAMVKEIIMSTAVDLGAPSSEQGAGLINALAAVNAALSVQDGNGRPKARGDSLLVTPTFSTLSDLPGAREGQSIKITNSGSTTQHLAPSLETLGAPFASDTLNLKLDPSTDASFLNVYGDERRYVKRTFYVPAGAQHLDAAIAYQASLNNQVPFVFLALLDPSGRQAAYSFPQGPASAYGHVDVVMPAAGTWTAVIWTDSIAESGYSGPVKFTWAVERYGNFGSISPARFDLAPGASEVVTVAFSMPAHPGDLAAAIRFDQPENSNGTSRPEIPVSLRTLVPIGSNGGNFSGTLTGGNGRPDTAPTQTFAFDVPPGVQDMSLVVDVADSGYLLEGFLVDPQGMPLSVQVNLDPITGAPEYALQHFRYNPQPGRWRFILLQDYFSSGNQTSLPFTARINFDRANISAAALPNAAGVQLKAGTPVTIPVNVTNTGAVTALYFADARLRTSESIPLLYSNPAECGVTTLPGACTLYFLPTEISSVQFVAQSPVPIAMEVFNDAGFNFGTESPYLYARQISPSTVASSLDVPEVPYGLWLEFPTELGPFSSSGAPVEPVSTSASVWGQAFDSAVTSDIGDLWADVTLGTTSFTNGLMLAAGQTGTINVTITPSATNANEVVSGYLYIDTFNPNVNTGDEVARIPYRYTVVP